MLRRLHLLEEKKEMQPSLEPFCKSRHLLSKTTGEAQVEMFTQQSYVFNILIFTAMFIKICTDEIKIKNLNTRGIAYFSDKNTEKEKCNYTCTVTSSCSGTTYRYTPSFFPKSKFWAFLRCQAKKEEKKKKHLEAQLCSEDRVLKEKLENSS